GDDVACSDPEGPDGIEESETSWIECLRERLARSVEAAQSYLERYASDHHLLVARHDELYALLYAKDEQLAEQNALITTMRSRLLGLELQLTGPRDATDSSPGTSRQVKLADQHANQLETQTGQGNDHPLNLSSAARSLTSLSAEDINVGMLGHPTAPEALGAISCSEEFRLTSTERADSLAVSQKAKLPQHVATTLVALEASAHGLITAVQGANGINNVGFANNDSVQRNSGLPIPATEGDTSVIRNREIANGNVDVCGKTGMGGVVNIQQEMSRMESTGMASVHPGGVVKLTIHQVNQDGAGPYTCDASAAGDGSDWVSMQMAKNVPGLGFGGLGLAAAKDWPVEAVMPAGTQCKAGADGQTCLIRCRNAAAAGPFGSCAAVTQKN
ncbi:hypothetical protein E5Q_03036, partial [Mixia osmundae IAM 14324]